MIVTSSESSLQSMKTHELRTMCNNSGFSCRDKEGRYLPHGQLVNILLPRIGQGAGRMRFPTTSNPFLKQTQQTVQPKNQQKQHEQWEEVPGYVSQSDVTNMKRQQMPLPPRRNPRDPLPIIPKVTHNKK